MPRKATKGTKVHFGSVSTVDIFCIICLSAPLTPIALFRQTAQDTRCECKIKTLAREGISLFSRTSILNDCISGFPVWRMPFSQTQEHL